MKRKVIFQQISEQIEICGVWFQERGHVPSSLPFHWSPTQHTIHLKFKHISLLIKCGSYAQQVFGLRICVLPNVLKMFSSLEVFLVLPQLSLSLLWSVVKSLTRLDWWNRLFLSNICKTPLRSCIMDFSLETCMIYIFTYAQAKWGNVLFPQCFLSLSI